MGTARTANTKHQPPASSPIPVAGTLAPDSVALALIHALIPLGLREVEERYSRSSSRWLARGMRGTAGCPA